MANQDPHATTLLKGLDVLSILSSEEEGLKMADLALRLGQPRTTVLRLASTLRHYGLIEKKGLCWEVSPRFFDWTSPNRASRLRERFQPLLNSLRDEFNELIMLGVLEGRRVHQIAHAEGTHMLRINSQPVRDHPLETAAMGKLYLSVRSDLLEAPLNKKFSLELKRVREEGIAWNIEESSPGVFAVACWAGSPGATTPTISIAWPVTRFDRDSAVKAITKVRNKLKTLV